MNDKDASTLPAADAEPFDRTLRRMRRDRAAPEFHAATFLKDAMAEELAARLQNFSLTSGRMLDLGCHDGRSGQHFPGFEIICADAGYRFARAASGVQCDEDRLPFAPASFDAVISSGSLHGVNDLPGALIQVRRVLRPGGVFLASFVAGGSFPEIREAVMMTEDELRGGIGPRFLPMVDPQEAPGLLQRAGFADPVVDVHSVTVRYSGAAAMLADLRTMGEGNILNRRERKPMPRALYAALVAAVDGLAREDGRIAVPLQILTLTGRAPEPS